MPVPTPTSGPLGRRGELGLMEPSLLAGFVALGLCVPLVALSLWLRWRSLRNLFAGPERRDKPPKLPPGRNPYHLP